MDEDWTYRRVGDTPMQRFRNCKMQIAAALLVKKIHIERFEELRDKNLKETAEEVALTYTKGIM